MPAISLTATTYNQNFNTLASSGSTSGSIPSGWEFSESGTNANTTYGVSNGTSGTGNTYSYGTGTNTERALGGLQSDNLIPTFGVSFTNNTGSTIASLSLNYFGEQWRLGATDRTDRLDFQYSLDATSVSTGTWTDFNSLDFSSPVTTGALSRDGNLTANRTNLTGTISGLSIANGQTFYLRWQDFNPSGADDGLAIDDFSLTPNIAPTNLSLSNTSINENVAANSTVGDFSSTDANTGDTFTYSLVAGAGSTDNSAFSIVSNQLQINASPDFETKSSYSIRVRTTDSTGLTYEKPLTVNINDLNEAPTDLTLSNTNINENVAANSTVGNFSSTDPNTGDTFTYSLVAGAGSTDNSAFSIVSNQLQINASPDFETKSSYSIRVRTTDSTGLTYEKPLTVNINNLNEAPTDLTLSNTNINENVAANSTVGNFSSTDPDTGNTFTYSLVAGAGSTDNSAFSIVSNQLQINASPDFETKSSYNIRVRTTDAGGLTYEKPLTVNINNLNEAPTDLTLSNTNINENVAANSTVGNFSSTDPDTGNTFTYSLVAGTGSTDNSAFSIVSNQLQINASPDFETKSSYSILVRTTDAGGLTYEKPLTVNINDIDEFVYLTPNNDILNGTAGADQINGLAGSDVLYGKAGNDTIDGGDGNDIVYGGDDNDLLRGGNGSDRLYGDAGNDELLGEVGNDILYGGDGDDILNGGAGSDQLYGNAGIDTFVLASGMGLDSIYNFQDGVDLIRLDGGLTFGDLQIAQSGTSTLIKIASTGVTLASLINTNSALIGAAHFISASPPPIEVS